MGTLVTDDAERAAQELLREELRPVVREAITEEVLAGIHSLIGHIPAAVTAAVASLEAVDENGNADFAERRQAAALILKHSAGNSNIVPDLNEGKQQSLEVHFNLPRPELNGTASAEGTGVIESKECDSCSTTKPLGEFVGTSDRCQACFDSMRESVLQLSND